MNVCTLGRYVVRSRVFFHLAIVNLSLQGQQLLPIPQALKVLLKWHRWWKDHVLHWIIMQTSCNLSHSVCWPLSATDPQCPKFTCKSHSKLKPIHKKKNIWENHSHNHYCIHPQSLLLVSYETQHVSYLKFFALHFSLLMDELFQMFHQSIHWASF